MTRSGAVQVSPDPAGGRRHDRERAGASRASVRRMTRLQLSVEYKVDTTTIKLSRDDSDRWAQLLARQRQRLVDVGGAQKPESALTEGRPVPALIGTFSTSPAAPRPADWPTVAAASRRHAQSMAVLALPVLALVVALVVFAVRAIANKDD